MPCEITPISAFQSTNLNSKIDSYGRLADRIVRSIGAPLVSVETHQDQIFENISIACEMFSKYAGYTREYLILDSALYEKGRGIRLDHLYTLANGDLTLAQRRNHDTLSKDTSPYLEKPESVYITSCPLSYSIFSTIPDLSGIFLNGLVKNQIVDKVTFNTLSDKIKLSSYFVNAPYVYTVVTNYHTTQNPIPSSIFVSSSSLSSKYNSGLDYNIDLLDSTEYSEISSYLNVYDLNNFFKSELTTYDTGSAKVLNDVPVSVFSDNPLLSSIITNSLYVNDIISQSDYADILNNLTQISIESYFNTSILSTYSITLDLSSNVWAEYPLLSGYGDASQGDIVSKNVIDLVESSIGLGFPLSCFIQNPHLELDGTTTSHTITSYTVINDIPSSVFVNNIILSGVYPNGLSSQSILTDAEYNDLLLNQNKISLDNFYSNRNTSSDIDTISAANLYYDALISNLTNASTAVSAMIEYTLNHPFNVDFNFVDYAVIESSFIQNVFVSHSVNISGNNYELFDYDGTSPIGYTYQLSYDNSSVDIQKARYSIYGLNSCYDYLNGTNLLSGSGDIVGAQAVCDFWGINGTNIINAITNEKNALINEQIQFSGNYSNFIITTDISHDVMSQFPPLIPDYGINGLSAGSIGNYDLTSNLSSLYVKVVNDAGGFNTDSFLSITLSTYQTDNYSIMFDTVNGISSDLLSNNFDLSAQFGSGIPKGTLILESEYAVLSTYQPYIPFSNNYHLSGTTELKTCNTDILSNIWLVYPNLFSIYSNGLSSGTVLNTTEYNYISAETNGYFNISLFFENVSSTRYVFTNTNVLCSNMFSNSLILSSVYPNGIELNYSMYASEYDTLTSNFDNSISNFYKPKSVSTIHTDQYYRTIEKIPSSIFLNTTLSSVYTEGINSNVTLSETDYNNVIQISENPLRLYFCESYVQGVSNSCDNQCNQSPSYLYNNMFDYDVMEYRKVMAVTNFEEGSTTGVNTLFTIEQTLAQQTYFSYAMGNYGFDLISWYTVKNWLETREKVLALKRSFEFNDRTQYLRIYPEPTDSVRFYGVLDCYIEKPLRDLIKEQWVYKYALALTKIGVGYVRGKFGNVNIFGGQAWTTDIKTDGITERDKLEEQLYTSSAALGDSDPSFFIVG